MPMPAAIVPPGNAPVVSATRMNWPGEKLFQLLPFTSGLAVGCEPGPKSIRYV